MYVSWSLQELPIRLRHPGEEGGGNSHMKEAGMLLGKFHYL